MQSILFETLQKQILNSIILSHCDAKKKFPIIYLSFSKSFWIFDGILICVSKDNRHDIIENRMKTEVSIVDLFLKELLK